ncbi:MAG: hypothetical protein QXW80_05740 [Candidatus Micrarchaeia archaeon]
MGKFVQKAAIESACSCEGVWFHQEKENRWARKSMKEGIGKCTLKTYWESFFLT